MFGKLLGLTACFAACTALVAATAAGSDGQGLLKGRTAQGRKIHLEARRESVKIRHFSIQLRCHGGFVLIDIESGFLPSTLRRGGRIRDHQYGSTDEVWIRGRLRGRRLRGAIRVRDRWGSARCGSRWVRFHATRVGA